MEIESGKKEKDYKVLKKPETIARELQQFIHKEADEQNQFLKKRYTLRVEAIEGQNFEWYVWFIPVGFRESFIIAIVKYSKSYNSFYVDLPIFQRRLGAILRDKYFSAISKYFAYSENIPSPYLNIKKKGVSLWK